MNTHLPKTSFISQFFRWAVAILLASAGTLSSSALTITWTNSASGSFGNAANWNPNQVPGAGDTAVITTNGITVSLDTTRTVSNITLGGSANCGSGGPIFSMAGNVLLLNGTFTINTCGQYTLDSGELDGNSTNALLLGQVTWTGGLLNGTLTLGTNATFEIVGANLHDMPTTVFTNYGMVVWDGILRGGGCGPGTQIYNYGLWNSTGDFIFTDDYGCNGSTFNNFGTFRKSVGSTTNSTQFRNGVAFNSAGVVDIQAGYLSLQSGGSFSGGFATNNAGIIQLAAGGFTISGTVTSANMQQIGANLAGNNVLNGAFTWISGNWNNANVTIAANSFLKIIGGAGLNDMATSLVTNYGTVQWVSGTVRGGGCNGGSHVYNYGLWDAQCDSIINDDYGCNNGDFNNFGTFRKSVGSATNSTQIRSGINFNSTGVVDIRAGTLQLESATALTGGTATNNGGTILLVGNSYNINGTVTDTNMQLVSGVLAGNNVIHGGFTWVAGTWNGANVTIATNSLVNVEGAGGLNDLATCNLTNYGTLAWISGTMRGGGCNGGTQIYNYGLWDAQGDFILNDDYGCNNANFFNFGTFRKSVGSATNSTVIANGMTFNNAGKIDAQAGVITFQCGGTWSAGTATNSSGIIQLAADGYNINGTLTGANVQMVGGSLIGNNILAGAFTWIGGAWNNASVTIATNSVLTIEGGTGNNDMATTIITNYGTVEWISGTLRGGGCNGGSAIYNYGLWDSHGDSVLNNAFTCNGGVFDNFGTFRKSLGAILGSTQIQTGIVFNNAGKVDVEIGTLSLQGGGSFSGGTATNNAGLLQLAQGGFNINGTVTGTGVQQVGTANLFGSNVLSGGFAWIGGNWDGATVTIASNCLVQIEGGLGSGVNDMSIGTITNYGTVAWSSGTIEGGGCSQGSAIYNYGVWDSQGDLTFNDAFACNGGIFDNFGTFTKTEGTNATVFQSGITFVNTGTVSPLVGLMQFVSTPSFASGNLKFGIGGSTNYGRIAASGTVSLGGAISAVLVDGYSPALGSQYAVLTYGGTNGIFTDYTGLNAGSGVAFTPTLGPTSVVLTAVATNFSAVGPTIIAQPGSRIANYGDTVSLQVGVSGTPPLVFQWSHNLAPIAGATNPILTLSNVTFTSAGNYSVMVSNSAGSVVSQPASLTVNPVAPSITSQPPGSITVPQGSNVTITAGVAGEPPPIIQWVYNGNNLTDGGRISGSATTSLTISNVQPFDAGNYSLTAANGFGSATSSTTVLHINFPDLAVAAISTPTNGVIGQFVPVVFTITNIASGFAEGPWVDEIFSSTNANGTNPVILGTATFFGTINPNSSTTVTQNVIMPANARAPLYLGVVVNSENNIPEITTTNNSAISTTATTPQAADLVLKQFSSPPSAQFGQSISINFAVTNTGTASATANWNDKIYLSSSSNSLSGATVLASIPGTSPLAPGAGYTRSQSVTLPLASNSVAGSYFLIAAADADNVQLESSETNNQLSDAISLTLPPLPDLAVINVGTPTNGIAGQNISVSWTVTNQTVTGATAPWSESIYLVPASVTLAQFNTNPAAYPRVGAFTFTNNLAGNGSITRAEQVTIPIASVAGDLKTVVVVDSNNDVVEQNETNNATLSTNDIQVPLALAMNLPVTSINENDPQPNINGTVSRNGDTTSPLIVTLASSATNHLLVQGTTTILAGQISAPFTATVLDDGVPGTNAEVTLTASATSYQNATGQILVVNTDIPTLNFGLTATQINQGQTVTVTVFRSTSDNSQPLNVSITTSAGTQLQFPPTVTIPAGSNSVSFLMLAAQNTFIAPDQLYSINASAPGYNGVQTGLLVRNDNAPMLAISLDRTNISEADGPSAAMATITRVPVTDAAVTVDVASTDTTAARVPAQVTIPSLQASVSFNVAAVNDPTQTGPKTTVISAQTVDTGGNLVGSIASQALTVQDANGPILKVSIANKVVDKGVNPATTATVTAVPPPTNTLVVTLTSSATNEATVPASVTLSAGQTNATFNIASLNDGQSQTSQFVSITASATNYASGSAALNVTDIGTSDLVISSINVPPAAYNDQSLSIGFRLLNQGLGALSTGVSQGVFLTTDPSSGNNIFVGSVMFGGPLAAGQFVDQTLVVPAASLPAPGTYYVVVTADINNQEMELNENNNTLVSTTPVAISPEYTATVQAGVPTSLAGVPVPLSGSATLVVGGPAATRPVNILITVRGIQRVISTMTDAQGNFSTPFNPLPNEGGAYTAAAVAPGVVSAPAQTQFSILGFSLNPNSLNLQVIQSSSVGSTITLQNFGDVPLTGLTTTVMGAANNLSVSNTFSASTLAANGTITMTTSIAANDASIPQSSFVIHVSSAEGAYVDLPVLVSVTPLLPHLAITQSSVASPMVRGDQTVVTFEVLNVGGAPTGPVVVSLPSVPWLSVGATNPLPSIDPGGSNQVTLILTPAANMALGPYTGTLELIGSGTAVQVPFTFTAVSDAHGALMVSTVDEFTYFASNSPPLTNAAVTLLDPFTSAVVASGVTDSNGNYFVSNIMEGTYELDVSAAQHAPFRGEAIVSPGQTNNVLAFLSVETVTYVWTVVPTTVQDSNNIVITTTFEANVPAPVIVPTPASIDLSPLTEPGQVLDIPLTLVNEGLIAVSNVTLNIPTHPMYRFDVLTADIGSLAAHGTITVPLRITRLAPPGQSAFNPKPLDGGGVGPCNIQFGLNYSYPCGPFGIYESVNIAVTHVSGNCTPTPVSYSVGVSCNICGGGGGGGGGFGGGGGGIGGGSVSVPPSISLPPQCNQCYQNGLDCLIGFIPVVGCVYSIVTTCAPEAIHTAANPGFPGASQTIEDCSFTVIGCVGGPVENIACCLQSAIECVCQSSSIGDCLGKAIGSSGGGAPGPHSFQPLDGGIPGGGLSSSDLRDVYLARSYVGVQFMALVVGDTNGEWFSTGSGPAFGAWFNAFTAAAQPSSDGGAYISPLEASNLMAMPVPNTVSPAEVASTISRWNLTVSNWSIGLLSPTQAPVSQLPGMNTNFIDAFQYTNLVGSWGAQLQASQAEGFSSPADGLIAALQESGKQSGATCARIVLEIDQSAVLTRDAFHATLQLNNGGTVTLSNISVNLSFQNAGGQDVTSLFGIEAPVVSGGLTAVDGSGTLAPGATGDSQWTLLPTLDAAPTAPTNYLVSGTFSYTQNGIAVTIPLSPAPIAVQPSPQLYLDYFLQRDVFGDDPFTPEIEPSIPFPLAVMVQNKGYGVAQSFQITSAQPKIIDNEKGLLINFTIIGTDVSGQPQTPSLTANFGDIEPMSVKVADFLFISSLQGLFIDYNATFTHVDPLGNPRLSLIQAVNIHEMTHMVQADRSFDDGLPDFLSAVMPNFEELPDTLFLSDGTTQPVSVVQAATPDALTATNHLNVQLTANCPAGFMYMVIPDPGNGAFTLTGVQRADGSSFLAPNFYLTDRTFTGQGQTPLRENDLHLFDYNTNGGPVTYTLQYAVPTNAPQTNPPISSVFALQTVSPAEFGVAWSGANLVGQAPLAFYDIYSSDNGGSFTNWQSHTTATSAVFDGQNGHTYSFYSIATDTVGNREATPSSAQATTTVNVTNYAPTISVTPRVTISAGQSLQLDVTAFDSNVFDNLTFTLGPGSPTGVQVNPLTGHISWQTSLAQGGTTNPITVVVTDDGTPPMSSSATVQVVLSVVADPPVLAPIGNYIITEGDLLTFTNSATDDTVPARTLSYSLGAGAPSGASVSPTMGVFQWRPLSIQAPSTNIISVVVQDNGTPSLSATQQFQVIVRAELAEFTLSVGSTNVLAGTSGFVPVNLASSLNLTNLSATFQGPLSSTLTNFTIQGAAPEVLSTLLQPLGNNLYSLNLTLNPNLNPGGKRTLAQLNFDAPAQPHSAIVPLVFSQPAATESDGTAAPKPGTGAGRVFVLGGEPVLDGWIDTNGIPSFALYGQPGGNYEVDYSIALGTTWQSFMQVPLTNTFTVIVPTNQPPQVFYRAFKH